MAKIKQIHAREILDSRGNPTIETTVVLNDNVYGVASCPSGASIGTYEASELRDNDPKRYTGLGVLKAIENIEKIIAPKLIGKEVTHQAEIDSLMIQLDGTQNKGMLGANAMLSVSMAVVKAASQSSVLPIYLYLRQFIKTNNESSLKIPKPLFNIINGGKHASFNLDFQEFMIIPATSKTYEESLIDAVNIYKSLKEILKQNNLSTLIGDEGGFAPNLPANIAAFDLLKQAVDTNSLRFGFDVFFGADAASNSFYKDHNYLLKDRSMPYSTNDLIAYYEELNKKYSLLYLEDPFSEDDWDGWVNIMTKLSGNTIITGDDLTVTNPYRLQMALSKKAVTAIVIKPNQIGTVIEALAVVEVAKHAGLKIIVSHRSGETNDDFIADFAVAVGADFVKFGAPARGERVSKYNRLSQIDRQLRQII